MGSLVVALIIGVQLIIGAAVLFRRSMAPSRRWLAASLSVGVPVLGPGLALVSCAVHGRGVPRLDMDDEPERAPNNDLDALRRSVGRGPMVDRLLGDTPERRVALATATKRADAASIAALRWTIDHGEGEAAVEAAITLEAMTLKIEEEARAACGRAREAPTYDNQVAAAKAIARRVQSGLADPTLIVALADQGAGLFSAAVAQEPERRSELLEPWARLELSAIRPQAALALLEVLPDDLDDDTREILTELRRDAVFGARRFDILDT